ncbi:MAG: rhomboid family intramembrane serine protease [Phycisphaerales bacterium]
MGIYDRQYYREDEGKGMSQMQFRLPTLTPVVKYLLIINVTIYVLSMLIRPFGFFVYSWFEVDSSTLGTSVQLWRLIGYQFLHDPNGAGHIIMNMLGLYMLGPTLEKFWQSKKFLIFYLACGTAGGLFYILLSNMGVISKGQLIGASGSILGMLAACAILFPHFVVFLLFFPVPIRIAAILFIFLFIGNIFLGGKNAGGDAAHLAGMVVGACYVYFWPKFKGRYSNIYSKNNWEKNFKAYNELQQEVDRILAKVNDEGIASLTKKEKKTLEEATRLEQMKSKY